MKKGKFIVFEGGEGAGKTSCLNFLKNKLFDRDDMIFTREPGGTIVGEKVREILLQEKMDVQTELFLFCGIRSEIVKELIRPALESGINVICDRFYPSTETYQIRRHGLEDVYLKTFRQLNKITIGNCVPDAIVYLDVEPEIGLARKRKSADGICTKFDRANIEEHNKIRKSYIAQFDESIKEKREPFWYFISTTNMPQNEVEYEVLQLIQRILDIA